MITSFQFTEHILTLDVFIIGSTAMGTQVKVVPDTGNTLYVSKTIPAKFTYYVFRFEDMYKMKRMFSKSATSSDFKSVIN